MKAIEFIIAAKAIGWAPQMPSLLGHDGRREYFAWRYNFSRRTG